MHRTHFARACFAFCATVLTSTAAAQTPLTLGECVRRALANGFESHIAAEDLAIAREDIPIARGQFDPQLSASTGRFVNQYGQFVADPTLPNSLLNTRIDQTTASIELSQRLPTGTDVGISADQNRLAISPTFSPLNPSYTSGVRLTLTQPLLKGFGRSITMLPIKRAEATADLAQRDYESRGLDIIENTEIAFYQLAGARDQLAVLQVSLDFAQALRKEAGARHEAGMATQLDVLQAEVGEANARLAVLDGERIVHDSEDELRALIGQFELDISLGPTVLDPRMASDAIDINGSYELAQKHSPVLQAQRAALNVAELDVRSAENDLKLDLGLHAEVGLAGTNRDSSSAFSEAFGRQGSDWQVSLRAVYPIGRTAEHAHSRQTNSALRRETLRVQQLEQRILVEVRSAVREVTTRRESVDIAAFAAERSERQYTAEKDRFTEGLSTGRRVLEAQADLERARLTKLQTRLDLFRSRATLRRIEGSAFGYYNVALPPPQ